jgi:hypothetical protein
MAGVKWLTLSQSPCLLHTQNKSRRRMEEVSFLHTENGTGAALFFKNPTFSVL